MNSYETVKCTALVLFAKEPRIGQNKSRLAKKIGWEASTEIYSAMAHDVWNTMKSTGLPCFLSSNTDYPWLPDPYKYITQPNGSFGTRIKQVLNDIYQDGINEVIALAPDTPHLSLKSLQIAVEELNSGADLVTCPSDDGGLVLLALKLPSRIDLASLPFETQHLSETIKDASKSYVYREILPGSFDIDEMSDLVRLVKHRDEFEAICPLTFKVISELSLAL